MEDKIFKELFSKDFCVLSFLYDEKHRDDRIAITQQEIAERFDLSRATVNTIFGRLKKNGFIRNDGSNVGRYIIEKRGVQCVKSFRKAMCSILEV